jgi:23S rRNA pseudouridine1911/1915/1917 synthase
MADPPPEHHGDGAFERVPLVVPAGAADERLDRFLAEPLGSRARAQRLIARGLVRVDGVERPARHRLAAGAVIELAGAARSSEDPEPTVARTADVGFVVRFEDPHVMVVDKPAGLVVHPGRGHRSGTLAQALAGSAAGGEDPSRAGIVHRLDRDTSGLLIVARSERAHRGLRAQMARRRVQRRYVALVEGHPPARSGTIDAAIGRDRRVRTRLSTDTDVPRSARTHFRIARMLPRAALLDVTLETGRTHQIRAHLKEIGHPVAGDPEYGTAGLYGLRRQFLHAAELRFEHPITGQAVTVSSPLPEDLERALRRATEEPGQS